MDTPRAVMFTWVHPTRLKDPHDFPDATSTEYFESAKVVLTNRTSVAPSRSTADRGLPVYPPVSVHPETRTSVEVAPAIWSAEPVYDPRSEGAILQSSNRGLVHAL